MQQKMIINVDSPTKLNNLKDGDIIIWDGTRQCFYVTDKKHLFYQEEKERKEYQKLMELKLSEMQKLIEGYKEHINTAIKHFDDENTNLKQSYNDFLEKYKKTNEKVIEMVESVVNGQ